MKSIVKNTTIYTLGNILPQAVGFILLPIYTKYLTPHDYGIVSSMQVLSTVFILLFTFSIDKSVYRLYFDYKTEEDKKDYLGTISISLFIISTVILILIFLFKNFISQIYSSIEFYPFFFFSILAAFFSIYSLIPKIYFQVNSKPKPFFILYISQFLLNTLIVLWFIVFREEGAVGLLKGNMIANLIMLPFYLYILQDIVNFKLKFEVLK